MTDLKDFLTDIFNKVGNTERCNLETAIEYLENYDWFGTMPLFKNGHVWLTDEQLSLYTERLIKLLGETNEHSARNNLYSGFEQEYPITYRYLNSFLKELDASNDTKESLVDFLAYHLSKEIPFMNDNEIGNLVGLAADELIKGHGDFLTFFLAWLKNQCKTTYKNDYVMRKRITLEGKKEAYDFDEYLELLYYLFNEDYIADNEMYQQAAQSKNYADTWLYLSLHFICSLRQTDLERIKHPVLIKSPEETLQEIMDGTFCDNDARSVLLSVVFRQQMLQLTPNKTAAHSGIASFKINIPHSCEVHLGTLFAIAEAHRLLRNISDDTPLIRRISDYDRINRYMGEEIGSLFLESNFRARSANKSYLQSVYMLADDIIGANEDIPNVKGYMLASLARSHKGSYGEFATQTATYLQDAKFNGLTAEFVAKELFERGVLSFIPSMLLKIITNGEYDRLTVSNQTKLIQELDLSPYEIEQTVDLVRQAQRKSEEVIKEVIVHHDSESIMDILHRIGNGDAFSKEPEYLCLLTVMGKVCPYKHSCSGCQYEISTKSTLFLLISEYNRMSMLYEDSDDDLAKNKYRRFITEIILPQFDEILTCTRDQYGEQVFHDYETLIKENIVQ